MKKRLTIIAALVLAMPASADIFKRYQIKSGSILYDVSTIGNAPGLTTKTNGVFRLVFDDWGAKELKEEDLIEIQTGDFYDKRTRHSMTKLDYGTIYTVNFDENVTYQTRDKTIDIAIAKGVDMSTQSLDAIKEMKAKKIGTDTVADHECDLWQLGDQTICMYKGIPLSIEIKADGFISTRTAQVVKLGEPISDSEFALPDYAVLAEEGYRSNKSASVQAADYVQAIKKLDKNFERNSSDRNDSNLAQDQINTIINSVGAPYLARQKEYLPTLFTELKKAKECIAASENADTAKECIVPVNKINDKLGDSAASYDYRNWKEQNKKKALKSITKEIADLNVTINCVQKSKLTTEVIICTEGSLKPKE